MNFLAADSVSTADYRRQARRIRASFAGNSFLTQRALGDLARRRDLELERGNQAGSEVRQRAGFLRAESGPSEYLRTGLGTRAHSALQVEIAGVVERGFSERAAAKLRSFGFTFSDRVELLNTGEKLGISRFRANLLLAMLENAAPNRQPISAVGPAKSFAPSLLMILVIEIAVVAGIVWLIVPA